MVVFEWDVATDHVEEEDAEGPDGGGFALVPVAANPLWGTVHTSSCTHTKENTYINQRVYKIAQNIIHFNCIFVAYEETKVCVFFFSLEFLIQTFFYSLKTS